MAVNLIDQFGRDRARTILESSFAQFQADRSVVDLARTVRQQEESLLGYTESMTCHLGDFTEYAELRRRLSDVERAGVGADAPRAAREKRQHELTALRRTMRGHPCHDCPDRENHARWAERWWKLHRKNETLNQQIRSRTGAVARVFDRVSDVLLQREYLVREDGAVSLTSAGRSLKRIYGDRDLLVAECLRLGAWNDLDVASLAAMAAAMVYEPRREEGETDERSLPRGNFLTALDRTERLWAELDDLEREHRLPGSNPVSTGLSMAMYGWARGRHLGDVLVDTEMAAGDFVRWCKQTIDLLDQLSIVGDGEVGRTARSAIDAVRRGIVAYSSLS